MNDATNALSEHSYIDLFCLSVKVHFKLCCSFARRGRTQISFDRHKVQPSCNFSGLMYPSVLEKRVNTETLQCWTSVRGTNNYEWVTKTKIQRQTLERVLEMD